MTPATPGLKVLEQELYISYRTSLQDIDENVPVLLLEKVTYPEGPSGVEPRTDAVQFVTAPTIAGSGLQNIARVVAGLNVMVDVAQKLDLGAPELLSVTLTE